MKNLLLGIIAINLTIISINLTLRSIEPVQAEDTMSMSETTYSCSWRTLKYMHLPPKKVKSNVKYRCEKGELVSVPARYVKVYCDSSQPIYFEDLMSNVITTNRGENMSALYSCTYNGKKFEEIKNVCILSGATSGEKCIDTETEDLVKVKRQN